MKIKTSFIVFALICAASTIAQTSTYKAAEAAKHGGKHNETLTLCVSLQLA